MSSRYYDTGGSGSEIKPGQISAELREALNLAENDIPIWIYRMRALGYPPGWLSKAVVDTNDIFDTDSPSGEESNKRKNISTDEVQYDHSKLIEYPGFNAPMPPNTNDYHYYLNMPPMLEHQQLEYAKKHMCAFEPAPVPKRTKTTPLKGNESSSSLEGTTSASEIQPQTNSPSYLEGPASPDDNEEASNSSSSNTKPLEIKQGTDQASKSNLNSSLSGSEIKLVSKGSPMPKPVERLPLERFSEGVVGELLYFENIPSSTGKFDSIRGLLNTIRRSKSESDTSFEAHKRQ